MATTDTLVQTIDVPLQPGDYVQLYEDVSVDSEMGMSASIFFEGRVTRHIPETGLIEFEERNTSLPEFRDMLREAESVQVIRDLDDKRR